jgi:hypothetical protein
MVSGQTPLLPGDPGLQVVAYGKVVAGAPFNLFGCTFSAGVVTFSAAQPDTNYLVNCWAESALTGAGETCQFQIYARTVTGFTVSAKIAGSAGAPTLNGYYFKVMR